jgi:hypothetical protein
MIFVVSLNRCLPTAVTAFCVARRRGAARLESFIHRDERHGGEVPDPVGFR